MKKRVYKTTSGGSLWHEHEVDTVLNRLLACNTQSEFTRACNELAVDYGRGGRKLVNGKPDGRFIRRFLWGLATKTRDYYWAGSADVRFSRLRPLNSNLTWAEIKVIEWASHTKTTGGSPQVPYIAYLLQRPIKMVEKAFHKHGPARGRKGFDATPKKKEASSGNQKRVIG